MRAGSARHRLQRRRHHCGQAEAAPCRWCLFRPLFPPLRAAGLRVGRRNAPSAARVLGSARRSTAGAGAGAGSAAGGWGAAGSWAGLQELAASGLSGAPTLVSSRWKLRCGAVRRPALRRCTESRTSGLRPNDFAVVVALAGLVGAYRILAGGARTWAGQSYSLRGLSRAHLAAHAGRAGEREHFVLIQSTMGRNACSEGRLRSAGTACSSRVLEAWCMTCRSCRFVRCGFESSRCAIALALGASRTIALGQGGRFLPLPSGEAHGMS
mmetsp:Transcript_12548/g.44441  ORF Transcript_12548/g.44441 Transcript_12548/m.44441 type:complete len:268 (+) Transcript_12548:5930-6733(+)